MGCVGLRPSKTCLKNLFKRPDYYIHCRTLTAMNIYINISDFILIFKVKLQFVIDTACKGTESYNDISLIRKRLGVA